VVIHILKLFCEVETHNCQQGMNIVQSQCARLVVFTAVRAILTTLVTKKKKLSFIPNNCISDTVIYFDRLFLRYYVQLPGIMSAAPKKTDAKPKKPTLHPKYSEMVKSAIAVQKERGGSSRQAILKYIMANYKLGGDAKSVNAHLKIALRNGVKSGSLNQSKGTGASGSFRIGEKEKGEKKPRAKKVTKPKAAAKPKAPKLKNTPKKAKKDVKKSTKSKKPKATETTKPKKVAKSTPKKATKSPKTKPKAKTPKKKKTVKA